MWLLSALRQKRVIDARSGWSRAQLLDHQKRALLGLLEFVWSASPFYRAYYGDHGIRREDLPELSVSDLPMTDKALLMESFDRISGDPALSRDRLQAWLGSDRDEPLYDGRYVVIHTSGTSGSTGIFVYDKAAWTRIRSVFLSRASNMTVASPFRRARIALCAATHGRFGAVTAMKSLPRQIFRVEECSVLDPITQTIETLNRFRPDHLVGYAGTLHELAIAATNGRLHIRPRSIASVGEILSDEAFAAIEKAFGQRPMDGYAASESPCIAIQAPGKRALTLMEDEHVFELLDDHGEPVAPGEVGRVVLTPLYNRVMPLIRYPMGDYATRGHRRNDDMLDNILRVEGRVNDALPVTLDDGSVDTIHPIVPNEFFVPGAQAFQFVSETPRRVRVRYVAETDRGEDVERAFARILELKGAGATTALAERAGELGPDPRTGKHRLVVIDDPDGQGSGLGSSG